MMSIVTTSQFRKDYRRAKKRGRNLQLLEAILTTLARDEMLDGKYLDHALTGDLALYRECHIQPDWLLIYRKEHDQLVLIAQRTGTHSDLFDA